MSANGQQHKQLKTSHSSPAAASETTPSPTVVRSSPNDDNTFEDDDDNNDCEMACELDGVSEAADKDNTISNNGLELASSNNNFARTFFNNTRRRMSSGLVLSYNFLKGASIKGGERRDST